MSQNAQFLITVDVDSIDRLSAALREARVPFDPIDDMTRIPQDSWEEALFTGRDLPHIIPIVNQHLEDQQHPRRIHPTGTPSPSTTSTRTGSPPSRNATPGPSSQPDHAPTATAHRPRWAGHPRHPGTNRHGEQSHDPHRPANPAQRRRPVPSVQPGTTGPQPQGHPLVLAPDCRRLRVDHRRPAAPGTLRLRAPGTRSPSTAGTEPNPRSPSGAA